MFNKKAKQVLKPKLPYNILKTEKVRKEVVEEVKAEEFKQTKKKKKEDIHEEVNVNENNEQ